MSISRFFALTLCVFLSSAGSSLSADEVIISSGDFVTPPISRPTESLRGVCNDKPIEVVFSGAGHHGPAQVEVFYDGASLLISRDTAFARDWTAPNLLVRKRVFCYKGELILMNGFGVKMEGSTPTFVRSEVSIQSGKLTRYVPPTEDSAATIRSFLN